MAIQTALAPIYSAMAQPGEMNSIVTNQENELQETERVANAVIDAAGGLINERNRNEVRRARAQKREARATIRELQSSKVTFGSTISRLQKMMETAQKVDETIKSAVERLNNGEKPIILVDNTSDNIMAELQAEQIANGENNGRPLDIKDIMLYEFNKLITKKVTHQETNEETGEVTTYVTRELIHGENEEIIAEIEHIKPH